MCFYGVSVCMFVTQARLNGYRVWDEICNRGRLWPGITHSLLFITRERAKPRAEADVSQMINQYYC